MTTTTDLAAIEAQLRPAAEAICIAEQRPGCWQPRSVPWRGKGINAKNTGFVILIGEGLLKAPIPVDEAAAAEAHERGHSVCQCKDESVADALSVRIMARARSTIRVRYDFSEMGSYDPMAGAALMHRLANPVTTLAWLTGGFLHYPSQGARARRIEAASEGIR